MPVSTRNAVSWVIDVATRSQSAEPEEKDRPEKNLLAPELVPHRARSQCAHRETDQRGAEKWAECQLRTSPRGDKRRSHIADSNGIKTIGGHDQEA